MDGVDKTSSSRWESFLDTRVGGKLEVVLDAIINAADNAFHSLQRKASNTSLKGRGERVFDAAATAVFAEALTWCRPTPAAQAAVSFSTISTWQRSF